jgi:hypothetical protein
MEDSQYTKYIGITCQRLLNREAFTALSFKCRGPRPFYLPGGSCLDTIEEARQFGFESVQIWSDGPLFNCKQMEGSLQCD